MSYPEFVKRLATIFLSLLFLAGLWRLQAIIMMGFLAIIMAVAMSIPAEKMQFRFVPRWLALLISILGMGVMGFLLVIWIFPTVVTEAAGLLTGLPTAFNQTVATYEGWRAGNETVARFLPSANYTELEEILRVWGLDINNLSDLALQIVNSTLPFLGGVGSVVLGIAANLAIVVFVSIFFLIDPMSYVWGSMMLVPKKYQPRLAAIWAELYQTLRTWIVAQSIAVVVTMFLVWFVLGAVLGMPNALAVAVIAGISTFIPNIGVLLPLIPIVIFTVADDITQLGIIILAYVLIQFAESNVLTPFIVRQELKIPAGAMLLFQLAAASLFGALGLLLAVPLLAVIITLVREIYSYDILGLRPIEPAPQKTTTNYTNFTN